ncbi:emp24/gp25L/p24 family/GOLD-domain-containing protein [Polychytrium aggregatum]|uniref:emp24/gp25L/p24 family/GOLD-domain-containing protein n=1 Tax=Polychytrium aggregatum TaxID=110093 RepID=UPI0022FE765F|nr:emp24/gp25L/p24 family/GOLD-domain-containing protein [Polychytrium aggregatum]KAI9202527.1 emp24/gp25L/p24 family/GOLD-domain-containing protein [Polychytrium aggregatum]
MSSPIAPAQRLVWLLLLLFFGSAAALNNFNAVIRPRQKLCFIEFLKPQERFDVSFQVHDTGSGNRDLDFWITSPNTRSIITQVKGESSYYHGFYASEEGNYEYCFSNQLSGYNDRSISFVIHGPAEQRKLEEVAQTQSSQREDVQALANEVANLANEIQFIRDAQGYIAPQLQDHKRVSEHTNSRVLWWSVLQAIGLILVTAFQVFFFQRMFDHRRLI